MQTSPEHDETDGTEIDLRSLPAMDASMFLMTLPGWERLGRAIVRRTLHGRLLNGNDEDDLSQELLFHFAKQLEEAENGSICQPYRVFSRKASNLLVDNHRRERRRQAQPIHDLAIPDKAEPALLAILDRERNAEIREMWEAVRGQMQEYDRFLVDGHLAGRTTKEMATEVGVSLNSCSVSLHRALNTCEALFLKLSKERISVSPLATSPIARSSLPRRSKRAGIRDEMAFPDLHQALRKLSGYRDSWFEKHLYNTTQELTTECYDLYSAFVHHGRKDCALLTLSQMLKTLCIRDDYTGKFVVQAQIRELSEDHIDDQLVQVYNLDGHQDPHVKIGVEEEWRLFNGAAPELLTVSNDDIRLKRPESENTWSYVKTIWPRSFWRHDAYAFLRPFDRDEWDPGYARREYLDRYSENWTERPEY